MKKPKKTHPEKKKTCGLKKINALTLNKLLQVWGSGFIYVPEFVLLLAHARHLLKYSH